MKTIHLVLKSQWFDMIASGRKSEEYREIKPYYDRLKTLKKGDRVVFHKGYSNVTVIADVKYCYQAFGIKAWGGDPDRLQWVIGIYVQQNDIRMVTFSKKFLLGEKTVMISFETDNPVNVGEIIGALNLVTAIRRIREI